MSPHWPFEASRGARWIVVLVGVVWLSLGAGDWFMRMRWFQWHQRLVLRPRGPFAAPYRPMMERDAPASRGGDLSRLVGIPRVAARYEEERPPHAFITDEAGFFNLPSATGAASDIVVVGDSYMLSGPGTVQSFPAQLADQSGLAVYNFAYAGRGSMWSILRLLLSGRIHERSPRVILWGLIEREIAGGYFAGVRAQLLYFDRIQREGPGRTGYNWREIGARRLRTSLPNTSLAAQFSGRLWTRVRFYALGRINDAVTEAAHPVEGGPTLLYVPSIDAMRWDERTRNLPQVVDAMKLLRDMCREHNAELAILLIPDKERIYEDLIPARHRESGQPLRPSILPELKELLAAEEIPAIELLSSFRQARVEGRRLYWRDDTHWHPDGIRLAAEVTWRELEPWWREQAWEPRPSLLVQE